MEVLLDQMKEICVELGWSLAIDMEKEKIRGMIVGSTEFIDDVVLAEESFDDYSICSPEDTYGQLQ